MRNSTLRYTDRDSWTRRAPGADPTVSAWSADGIMCLFRYYNITIYYICSIVKNCSYNGFGGCHSTMLFVSEHLRQYHPARMTPAGSLAVLAVMGLHCLVGKRLLASPRKKAALVALVICQASCSLMEFGPVCRKHIAGAPAF